MEDEEDDRRGGEPNFPPGRSARVSPVMSVRADLDLVGVTGGAAAAGSGSAAAADHQRANDTDDDGDDASSSTEEGSRSPKRAKVDTDIQVKVRDLLDNKLMGSDDAVKAEALRQLTKYFDTHDTTYPRNEEYRRAVAEWDGCQLVLNGLRYELDRAGGPNRRVACAALRFLVAWNSGDNKNERRGAMSRFNGMEVVASAMQAFPLDPAMQEASLGCLFNFASFRGHANTKYLQDVIREGCAPLIIRAMDTVLSRPKAQRCGIRLLELLCRMKDQDHSDVLIEQGALVVLAKAYTTYKNSNHPEAQGIRTASRRLMSKLHG